MVLPVVAMRTAPNAMRGFRPISSISEARSAASIESWFQTVSGVSSASDRFKTSLDAASLTFERDASSTANSLTKRKRYMAGTSSNLTMRS